MSPPQHQIVSSNVSPKAGQVRNLPISPNRLYDSGTPNSRVQRPLPASSVLSSTLPVPSSAQPNQQSLMSVPEPTKVMSRSPPPAPPMSVSGHSEAKSPYRVAPAQQHFSTITDIEQIEQVSTLPSMGPAPTTPRSRDDKFTSSPVFAEVQEGQEGLDAWLAQKLKEERKEVLSYLEDLHYRMMQQFLVRASQGGQGSAAYDLQEKMLAKQVSNTRVPNIGMRNKDTNAIRPPDPAEQGILVAAKHDGPMFPKAGANMQVQRVAVPNDATPRDGEEPEAATPRDAEKQIPDGRISAVNPESERHLAHYHRSGMKEFHAPDFETTSRGQAFEFFWAFMIFANTCVMAMNTQYLGLQVGYELSFRTYETTKEDAWPGGDVAFDFSEKFFTIMFTIELMARIYIYRWKFLHDRWAYFDTVVVSLAWVIFFEEDFLQINVTFVRLLRFSKMLRLMHLLRSQEIFDSLKLLVAAIKASVNTLFWSLMVLLLIQSVAGLLMVQLLESFLDDETKDIAVRRRVFGYFGTYWRSKITMFEITFANWVPSCRLLMDQVDELYAAFYMIYRCVIGFAVLMVVKAVFLQQTMKTTQISDESLAHEKARKKAKLVQKIEKLFNQLDQTGDGVLEWEELQPALQSGEMEAMLEVFDLEVSDFETLYKLLDDGDGQISTEEFVAGIQKIKGEAREVDMLECKQLVKNLELKLSGTKAESTHSTNGSAKEEKMSPESDEEDLEEEIEKELVEAEIASHADDDDHHPVHSTSSILHAQLDGFEATPAGQAFEIFFTFMIFANTCVMAMDAQYRGLERGYNLKFRTYETPAAEAWPGGEATFDVFEKIFTVIFTIEWIARFAIWKFRFLRDTWCYFDGVIIVLAWVIFFKKDFLSINVTFIRLARFSKILRLIHLLRSQEIFDSLKLLVAAIRASVNTLFWSLMILLLIQSVAGLFMVQVLEPFLLDKSQDVVIQRRVFAYWGTFWRSMLTMFEITMGNWVPSCRLLVDHVHEWYGVFWLIYRCVIGFAVLMVVQAVFIQQTMKTTKVSDATIAAQKARAKAKVMRRLQRLFMQLDNSGDGVLEWDEFEPALKSGEMAAMLEVFELEVSDFETLFKLLDDGDGKISVEEFVNGVEHIKGPAREIDLMEVMQILRKVESKVDERDLRLASMK